MRKLSPNDDLKTYHWESTVVICWKDRPYRPKALNGDTPVLCKIVSNSSKLKLEDFERVPPTLWSWSKAYFKAKYELKVIINVADILFEVWCHGLKLSEDRRIKVQWKEGAKLSRPLDLPARTRDILDRSS